MTMTKTTRTPQKIEELAIGQSIWDMHDGYPDFAALFTEPVRITDYVTLPLIGMSAVITASVRKLRCNDRYHYLNKMLVVIDVKPEAATLVASYDDRTFIVSRVCLISSPPVRAPSDAELAR